MKRLNALLLLVLTLTSASLVARDYTRLVNPFVGTDYTGNTYPGAQAPFGMVQLSPDNGLPGWDRIAGYFYPDSTIAGFSHTHLSGTGAGDLYDISFLPVTLPVKDGGEPLGIHSKFRHETEEAWAGYYKVHLDDYDINVELTAMPRVGIQRYTYPADGRPRRVILNLAKAMNWDATDDTYIEVVDSVTIRGYRYSEGWASGQKVFFATRFSQPFRAMQNDSIKTYSGKTGLITTFDFDTMTGDQLVVYTAISGTSMYGATRNLEAEAPVEGFDAYVVTARKMWNTALGRLDAKSENQDDLVNFYTALYHTMLAPTIYSDVDGSYRGSDQRIHKTDGVHYSTFSLWDTYRAAHPLFTITQPARVADMVNSFLDFEEQCGQLPVWSMWAGETNMMIGYHAVPIIVDAISKGYNAIDRTRALAACVRTANLDNYRSIGTYKRLGYVPMFVKDMGNDDWSLSRTLEYAYDDWCIYALAEAMGHNDVATDFKRRSQFYRNVWNSKTGFFQPKDSLGVFQQNFDPEAYTPHICESNAYHYLWSVQHDIDGLCKLMGGKKKMAARLDEMFTRESANAADLPLFSTGMIGQYAHGNEPSHHVIYLYNYVGQPWKTQQYASKVMHELYFPKPGGLCGNEDCGQTSAWFVMSAMGFYPVNPVGGRYEIGSPLFPELTLRLDNGRTLTIKAPAASEKNKYVKAVRYEGKRYPLSYVSQDLIEAGGTLEFEMTDQPMPAWY